MGSLPPPSNQYSPLLETERIFDLLCDQAELLGLPQDFESIKKNVVFKTDFDRIYFPIPVKETEVASALKGIEGAVAASLADLRFGRQQNRRIEVDLEKSTNFLFQTYLATIGGLGKLDQGVKAKLKDTDYLQGQSNPYRRMSANLYRTKEPGRFYHIHGSLEASTTLKMVGLDPYRPDLTDHLDIVAAIEPAVEKFTVRELEDLNAAHRQAGVEAMKHDDFAKTQHGETNIKLPPWAIDCLESKSPPVPLPPSSSNRILEGVKVLELCRIISGPTVGRILAEYGATVLKVTSPTGSDVPFFQVDCNVGKHTTNLDLKTQDGRKVFETLLADTDIVLDGYRPGAIEKLGYGPQALAKLAEERGKGFVYVNENCFGYEGEWAHRAGWQQIADCVSGLAWAQGEFMGISEPMVPPFPISDYGTGCMGAIAALSGLHHRTTRGGSWHGKVSLLQYDLLLFTVGAYPAPIQADMLSNCSPEFLALTHSNSPDQICSAALNMMRDGFPELFDREKFCETWYSEKYGEDVSVVKPVVGIRGIDIGFQRGSRPNGSDRPSWDFGEGGDRKR